MNYTSRLNKVRNKMAQNNIDTLVFMSPSNYFYMTGFNGSSGAVIITQREFILITDSRYIAQSKAQTAASDVEIIIHSAPLLDSIKELFAKLGSKTIGYEADHLLVSQLFALEGGSYTLEPQTGFIEEIRHIKDEAEIVLLRKAAAIGEEVLKDAWQFMKAGMTEIEVATRMESTMRKLGASGPSFDTIIASGIRGALPHGAASDKVLVAGELITIDFGVKYQGYCSDMTRTFALGTMPQDKLVELYNIVLEANLKGIAAVKPDVTGADIDAVSRNIIKEAGYGDYFGHGLGHAVGIDIHESPRLSFLSNEIIKPGMILTVEPGIYIEDLGGIRIEDTVVVTENGSDNFMTLPKELIVV